MGNNEKNQVPETGRIQGYYGSYQAAYRAVGKRYLESRKFSIQYADPASRFRWHPWVLIYYGKFV